MYHPPYDSRYHVLKPSERDSRIDPHPSILATMEDWSRAHPMIPCTPCRSRGYVADVVTPSDPGSRIGACKDCHGLGRQFVTVKKIRVAYFKLQNRTCDERGFSTKFFNDRAARDLKEETPIGWYWAARRLAEFYGVEVFL